MILNFTLNMCALVTIAWALGLAWYLITVILQIIYFVFKLCTKEPAQKIELKNPFGFLSLKEEKEVTKVEDERLVTETELVYKEDLEIIINITMSVMSIIGLIYMAEEYGLFGLILNYK